ncbi:hypothetical protein FXO37_00995 [Capsicum annuum]|nr:hypothetical protein FXO37_00995 [Capsicum annuum]
MSAIDTISSSTGADTRDPNSEVLLIAKELSISTFPAILFHASNLLPSSSMRAFFHNFLNEELEILNKFAELMVNFGALALAGGSGEVSIRIIGAGDQKHDKVGTVLSTPGVGTLREADEQNEVFGRPISRKGKLYKLLLALSVSLFTSICMYGLPFLAKCKPCDLSLSESCPGNGERGDFKQFYYPNGYYNELATRFGRLLGIAMRPYTKIDQGLYAVLGAASLMAGSMRMTVTVCIIE